MSLSSVLVRQRRPILVLCAHVLLWCVAWAIAFLLRFDFKVPDAYRALEYTGWVVPLIFVRASLFARFGLFHGILRYTGVRDLEDLARATLIGSALLGLAVYLGGITGFPRSILIIEALLAMLLTGGMRYAMRMLASSAARPVSESVRRVLVVGAGDSGEMLLREMTRSLGHRYAVVGLLDDDPAKLGARIHGVPVLGNIDEARSYASKLQVQEIVIAIPSASGKEMRRILDRCQMPGIEIRTLPSIADLIGGRVTVNQIREVAIEDLLGRKPVKLDSKTISEVIQGQVVLVTGAGGSIGSELCRQVCRFGPRQLVLVEQAENALYEIHRELRERFSAVDLVPAVADVCDAERIRGLMTGYRPHLVLHAAAHKHVPMMEANPGEAVKNNVGGTRVVANAAHEAGVTRFVMISTDKAVNPTSVMGCTKRVAELYVQSMGQRSDTRFVTVRFGNVLGSNGSVIPLFKEQIARGGPLTVTHPDMVRFFMTIPEASQLVLQAGAMGEGGEVYVLDMGEPVRILTLAEDLVTLSGLRPYEDVEIVFSGIRPGEKLYEELTIDDENASKTAHPKIYVGRSVARPWLAVDSAIDGLLAMARTAGRDEIRLRLREIVPEFRGTGSMPPRRDVIPLDRRAERAG